MAFKITKCGDYRERRNFSKIRNAYELKDLLEIQKKSYNWFIETGIKEVFEETGHKLEVDRLGFIHENFFSEDYQVAYVVDPIQKIEGFYFWINGKVERCKGFYVYDRAGAKISVEKEEKYVDSTQGFSLSNVLTYLLVVVVVFLVFLNLSQNKEIQKLKDRISILENNVNVIINDIYQPTTPSVDNVVEENKNE